MKLRSRIFLILFLVLAAYAILDYGIHRFIILPSFLSLERTEAQKDMSRCIQALRREIHHLDKFTNDWAAWDDMYRFVENRNAGFMESNLVPQTFTDNNLNIINIYNVEGELVWGESRDPETGEKIEMSLTSSIGLPEGHSLRQRESANSTIAGIYMIESGPLLVASRPIITSARHGPIRGSLVMGRLLGEALIKTLVEQTRVEHNYWSILHGSMPSEEMRALGRITKQSPLSLTLYDKYLSAYMIVDDIQGEAALLIRTDIPRHISLKGIATMRFAIISNLIAGMMLLGALLFLMQRSIVKPLSDLTAHAIRIRDTNNLSLRDRSTRKDEIGVLSGELDRMVEKLAHIHNHLESLVDQRTADLRAANLQLQQEITDRKRAEAFLKQAHDDLERQVQRRTAALVEANAQLSAEIEERRQAEAELHLYHQKLRSLSSELLLTEERERRRLATDLHDRIGQALTLSRFKIDGLLELVNSAGPLSANIVELSELIDQVLQDTRQLTFELSPPVLYELGLEAALEWLVEQFQNQNGLTIRFYSDPAPKPLDNALRVLIFQASRELLFNVVKHAQASRVDVAIGRNSDTVRVRIEDDGIGFDALSVNSLAYKSKGFGLFSIRERLRHIGGRLEIDSKIDQGTRVTLISPLQAGAKKEKERSQHENQHCSGGRS